MGQNDVRLYGQVTEKPHFYIRKGAETPHKCIFTVRTMSRFNNSRDETKIIYDEVVVMTEDPSMIERIGRKVQLAKNDMVYIKGMVCTVTTKRKIICSECEEEFEENGISCYIHPIHIKITETNISEERGYRLIQENMEVSNEVLLHGIICSDVNYSEEYHHANYKMAVKRQYHILQDAVDKRVDYPIINTYFEMADDDHKYVHQGTGMIVRGSIRCRTVTRRTECPMCGNEEELEYSVLEVVAHGTSYTENWEKPGKENTKEEQ